MHLCLVKMQWKCNAQCSCRYLQEAGLCGFRGCDGETFRSTRPFACKYGMAPWPSVKERLQADTLPMSGLIDLIEARHVRGFEVPEIS